VAAFGCMTRSRYGSAKCNIVRKKSTWTSGEDDAVGIGLVVVEVS
jgi:hypothetical protein